VEPFGIAKRNNRRLITQGSEEVLPKATRNPIAALIGCGAGEQGGHQFHPAANRFFFTTVSFRNGLY